MPSATETGYGRTLLLDDILVSAVPAAAGLSLAALSLAAATPASAMPCSGFTCAGHDPSGTGCDQYPSTYKQSGGSLAAMTNCYSEGRYSNRAKVSLRSAASRRGRQALHATSGRPSARRSRKTCDTRGRATLGSSTNVGEACSNTVRCVSTRTWSTGRTGRTRSWTYSTPPAMSAVPMKPISSGQAREAAMGATRDQVRRAAPGHQPSCQATLFVFSRVPPPRGPPGRPGISPRATGWTQQRPIKARPGTNATPRDHGQGRLYRERLRGTLEMRWGPDCSVNWTRYTVGTNSEDYTGSHFWISIESSSGVTSYYDFTGQNGVTY